MEGHIWLESEGLGKGSTVVFIVKLSIPDHEEELECQIAPSIQRKHGCTDFTGLKVLVADDNGVNRMATRALLVCLGCDVAVASSGWDCLQMISQPGQKFKVILLDVCMPAMDGYELAIRIQEKFPFRHERPLLVALTASTDRATKENCLKVGMDGVILKPVSLDKMQYVLAELLQHGFLCDSPRRI